MMRVWCHNRRHNASNCFWFLETKWSIRSVIVLHRSRSRDQNFIPVSELIVGMMRGKADTYINIDISNRMHSWKLR